MDTKRIWRRQAEERRGTDRVAANFYAIEVEGRGRYLRRVANVSDDGLLLESPLGDEQPGCTIELELPTNDTVDGGSLRVQAEVVYVHPDGRVGVRVSEPLPVESLGGRLPL
jgi:PilZ domain-containing protein